METKETYWQRARRLKREALVDLSMAEGYYLSGSKGSRYTVESTFHTDPERRREYALKTAEAVMYMGLRRLTKALRTMERSILLDQAKKNLVDRVESTALQLTRSDAFVKVLKLGGEDSPYLAKVAAAENRHEVLAIVTNAERAKEEEGLTPEQLKELNQRRKRDEERAYELAMIQRRYRY